MAEVDTMMLSQEHSDIRREAAEHANEIVKEGLKGDYSTQGAIKDARFDINSRIGTSTSEIIRDVDRVGDSLADRFFTVARDTSDLRAQVTQGIAETRLIGERTAKDAEIAVLRSTIEGQKNTQYLAEKISSDGEKTRSLINDLKYHDLNRHLVERNAELVEERHWGRRWFHDGLQSQTAAQFAALQSQMQNFNSQLSETRQGMVNFGTMAGVGQTSTANNVR